MSQHTLNPNPKAKVVVTDQKGMVLVKVVDQIREVQENQEVNCQKDHLGLALGLGQTQVQDHHQDEVSLDERWNKSERENRKQRKLLWNES